MMAAGRLLNFLNVFLCHHNVQCIIIFINAVPFIKQKLEYKSPGCNPDNWKYGRWKYNGEYNKQLPFPRLIQTEYIAYSLVIADDWMIIMSTKLTELVQSSIFAHKWHKVSVELGLTRRGLSTEAKNIKYRFEKVLLIWVFVMFVLMYYTPTETKNETVFRNINLCLSLLGCVIMSWSHVLQKVTTF